MPLFNKSNNTPLPCNIVRADRFITRLAGLNGIEHFDARSALHITPCSDIHTFGMDYPIDVVFLDDTNRVIKIYYKVKPKKIITFVRNAKSVLEFPPGSLAVQNIKQGDLLDISVDTAYRLSAGYPKRLWSDLLLFTNGFLLLHLGVICLVDSMFAQISLLTFCSLFFIALWMTRSRPESNAWLLQSMSLLLLLMLPFGLSFSPPLRLHTLMVQSVGIVVLAILLIRVKQKRPSPLPYHEKTLWIIAGVLIFLTGYLWSYFNAYTVLAIPLALPPQK